MPEPRVPVGDTSKARFIAAFIDNIVAFACMLVAVSVMPLGNNIVRGTAIVAGFLGYFFVLEGAFGRTGGKYFEGLIVRRLDGTRAGWKESAIRTITRIGEVNPVLFGAIPAGIIILSSQEKQRFGDMLAGTIVVSDKLEWHAPESTERRGTIDHAVNVRGLEVDDSGCTHWRSPLDIIAIKFKCCGEWYKCFECHRSLAGHEAIRWQQAQFDMPAVLCYSCKHQLTISEYIACDSQCPCCNAAFNPGCANHYDLYFATN
jgi:uncharacterized CHY-type Zn-finger protein/uncharacterized RDD family membrane protein YckC